MISQRVIDNFHSIYYNAKNRTWNNTYWFGTKCMKCPLDLWIYQEIIIETKPDVIIESGTADGGSALFLASICDLVGKGRIITVDIKEAERPKHNRIEYIVGDSINAYESIKMGIANDEKVMVILDSDHCCKHVLKEMQLYSILVSRGCYLIIEDSNINGHPVYASFGPGPLEAIQQFMKNNKDFTIDISREKFFLTFNPKGYLKRNND